MKNKVILLGGGSAAGKTLLTKEITSRLHGQVTRLSFDSYYRDQSHLSLSERVKINYDDPASVEETLFLADLVKLINNEPVDIPIYNFAIHNRESGQEHVIPSKYLVIDGIFALIYPEILALADLKVFVSAPQDVRLKRRLARDMKERGRSRESVLHQFDATVQPMHEKYIEPSSKEADIIFINDGDSGLDPHQVESLIQAIIALN